jgi:hypothetical protein
MATQRLSRLHQRIGNTKPLFRPAAAAARLRRRPRLARSAAAPPARGGGLRKRRAARRGAGIRGLDRRLRMG